ncbi:hypothetical protein BKA82DRAFT_4367593 [Pisolithus tinctorius]|nr:hypothetical protein BKA82DRAFT_4367593 [Pisolithus tinctorius]
MEQVRQISQRLLSEALSEHSHHSAEQYEQDQERQAAASGNHAGHPPPNPSPSNSPSPGPSSRPPSPPRDPSPVPPPPPIHPNSAPNPNPGPGPNPDPDPPPPPPPACLPPGARPYVEPEPHSLGPMNIQCPNYQALHFLSEKLVSSPVHAPHFGVCCLQGKVVLPKIQPWPPILQHLFDDPQDHRDFRKNICQYNNALAFTSVGVEVDRETVQGAGPASFCIHGNLHHLMGALMPPQNLQLSYAQLYIYDPQEATDRCLHRN